MSVHLLRRWINRLSNHSPHRGRPAKRAAYRGFRPQIDLLEDRCLPSTIFWSGNGGDGLWRRAENWVGGVVPGQADDAVIDDSSPPITVDVTAGSGMTVHSLTSSKDFIIDPGVSFTVTGGNSSVSGAFTLRPNATLAASGAGTTFTASGQTTITAANLFAQNGAVISLPEVTSYNALGAGFSPTLRADGAGSQLSLPNLTSWHGGGSTLDGNRVNVQATSAGAVDLSQVAAITSGNTYFQALDGGQINVSALTTFSGAMYGSQNNLDARRGGAAITAPGLTNLVNVDLNLGGNASLPVAALTSFRHGNIDAFADGGAGGQLAVPVTTIDESGFNSSPVFRADGAGSRLDLSAVTTWRGAGSSGNSNRINVQAFNGGVLDLSQVTAVSVDNTYFQALDGGQINLSAVTSFSGGIAGGANNLDARRGGAAIIAPGLTSLANVDLNLGGNASLPVAALTSLRHGNVFAFADGGAGGQLALPVTTIDELGFNGSPTFRADGAGSSLDLSAVTTWRGAGSPSNGNRINVQASNGGVVNLSQVAGITAGNTYFQALDGGQINVSALTSFTGALSGGANNLDARRGGAAISAPSLTSLANVDLNVGGAGSLTLSSLSSFQHGNIVVFLDGSAGQLAVPVAAMDELGVSQSFTFRADGAGSRLDLSAVNTWRGAGSASNGSRINVLATSGGVVDLSGLAQISDGNTFFQASGAGSQIDLDALTSFNAATRDASAVEADPGGTVRTGQLASINHVALTFMGTGSIDTSALASATNGHITATNGAAPSFPSLTDIDGSGLHVRSGAQLVIPPTVTSYNPALDGNAMVPGFDNQDDGDGGGDPDTMLVCDIINIIVGGGNGEGELISAVNGACIQFPCLETIDADLQFSAQGTNSYILMPLLVSFVGRPGHSAISASGGAVITVNADPQNPGSTAVSTVGINMSSPGGLNMGTLELDAGSSLGGAGTLTGNLRVNGGDVNASNGNLTVTGDYTQLGGTLTVRTNSTFTVNGAFTQLGGIATLLGGTLASALIDLEGGLLEGAGIVNASLRNSAQIDVGGVSNAGRLTVTGDYTQTAAGVLNIEIGGINPGADYDQLAINGAATLDGTLNVSRIRGYTPASGIHFQILTFGSSDGSVFATTNIDISFLPPTYDPNDVTLQAA